MIWKTPVILFMGVCFFVEIFAMEGVKDGAGKQPSLILSKTEKHAITTALNIRNKKQSVLKDNVDYLVCGGLIFINEDLWTVWINHKEIQTFDEHPFLDGTVTIQSVSCDAVKFLWQPTKDPLNVKKVTLSPQQAYSISQDKLVTSVDIVIEVGKDIRHEKRSLVKPR